MGLNEDKFKNLILYICSKAEPQNLGATKLDKILWYSDAYAYLMIGEPITGETYIKRQFGPFAPHFYKMIEELEADGKLCVRPTDHYGFAKKEYIPLVQADIEDFLPQEVSIIDDIIDVVCNNYTAKGISEQSHNDIWEMADIGDEIPYYAMFAVFLGEIDETDIEWANTVLASSEP
jgi:Protein of unknown function (DUF4065)